MFKKITSTEATIDWADFQKGNDLVFDNVFRHYFPQLCTFINSYLSPNADTEDLAVECLAKIWLKRHQLPDIQDFEAYLFQLTRNHCNDYLRRQKTRQRHYSQFAEGLEPTYQQFEKALIETFLIEQIFQEATALSRSQQQVLELFYRKGMTDREIGEVLQKPRRTVQSIRSQALLLLRRKLKVAKSIFWINAILFFLTSV